MSTKLQKRQTTVAGNEERSATYQIRSIINDGWKAVGQIMSAADTFGSPTAWAITSNLSRPAVVRKAPKAAEVDRQVERITSLLEAHRQGSDQSAKLVESIGTSIALLHSFVTLPLPVPIASDGEDDGASLFIDTEHLYGDLEISGSTVEYYLRSKTGDFQNEIYDVEDVEDGRIPPRLLGCLYTHHTI